MERININDYNSSLGPLICLDNIGQGINISYDELVFNHEKILDKNKTYYICCKGGYKSFKAVRLLEAYGYHVVQVLINNS